MSRIGVNPEKTKKNLLHYARHRVIIPVYIPNLEEDYYCQSIQILSLCIDSLCRYIGDETKITIINNASCKEAVDVMMKYVNKGLIDRYIVCEHNRGKVEPCLCEVRASFEEYVTIADADILFFEGWESAVFSIFKNIKRAGVVSCMPSFLVANYCNLSLFRARTLLGKYLFKYEIEKRDIEMVYKGLGRVNDSVDNIYMAYKDGCQSAIVGATHCVATYRRTLLELQQKKQIKTVFKNGLEYKYLDVVPDLYGFYRLSTMHCYAYHIGNRIDAETLDMAHQSNSCDSDDVYPPKQRLFLYSLPFFYRFKLARYYILKRLGYFRQYYHN